jgi:hypothetical protein
MSPANRFLGSGSAVVAWAFLAAPADATLIGDLVSVEYHFPDLGTIFEEHQVVVEEGAADTVTLLAAQGAPGNVNIEESSVQIDWAPVTFSPGNFNGLVVTDMDFFGPPASIVGLNIVTNAPGWNDAFASFTTDSIALNYASLGTAINGFSMTVNLLVQREAPEPVTLGLMALGLAAVGLAARRRSRLTTHDDMRLQASRRVES